ncbi:hypothetical protein ACFQU2_39545 [Siccirubricoccus deserti]
MTAADARGGRKRSRRSWCAAWAVAGGAALLLWPAWLNHYPLVFSDTGAFLAQTIEGWAIWDKPFVFGPALHAFHWRWSLWLPALAQGLALSWLLWLVQRVLARDRPGRQHPGREALGRRRPGHDQARTGPGLESPVRHLLLCAGLATLTAAPWFAALLIPDWLAPALVLAIFLLGFAGSALTRPERHALLALATLACAAHLSHLPLAMALALLVLAVRRDWRPALACALPLVLALGLLVATNTLLHGRAAVSPFGAVFALARLVADGPAARTIAAHCPDSGWHLCAWAGRLPDDADAFLWSGDGPVWAPRRDGAHPGGPISLAPEAAAILRETLWREPLGVLRAAAGNALRQLAMARVGDALVPDNLGPSVARQLALGFPAAEEARFAAGLQARGLLPGTAAPFLRPHAAVLLLGAAATLLAGWRAARRGSRGGLGWCFACWLG